MRAQKIQLICMPYQLAGLSSLSTALLATCLRERGIETVEDYLHFPFADILGGGLYGRIAEDSTAASRGELLFARDLEGVQRDDDFQRALERDLGGAAGMRDKLDAFRAVCLDRVEAAGAGLVGFSTSCHQLLPALWLARQIKERWPRVRTVFGGASCTQPMGRRLFEAYPEIDYVVSGYGEQPLLDLARGELGGGRRLIVNEQSPPMDELPVPDYGPFLAQAAGFGRDRRNLMLAFETSRGCWWGQKCHCSFCGLNPFEVAYQAKSSDSAVAEIRTLWERHGLNLFATDTILSYRHLREVMPRLAGFATKPSLFYEVKSNLRESDVRQLREANVLWIQPGIESLSTPLLKQLRKGVTAIQNLALLKWCREQWIRVSWNLLCAIPGERQADYEEEIDLMRRIPHLSPPYGVSPIRVDRFSPYFESPQAFGWSGLRPVPVYRELHPRLSEAELAELAYHFEAEGGALQPERYFPPLRAAVEDWKRRHAAGEGLFWDEDQGLTRIAGQEVQVFEQGPALAAILAATHEIIDLDELAALPGVEPALLEQLFAEGVLYREGRKAINLAVRLPRSPGAATEELPEVH